MAMKILSWNACGLLSHLDLLINYLATFPDTIDIICIQETHLQFDFNGLNGYQGFFKHRLDRRGGGVAIYVKTSIKFQGFVLEDSEGIGVKIRLRNNDFLNCFSMYFPPGALMSFEKLKLNISGSNNVIVGDFNAKNKLWGSQSTDARGRLIDMFIDEEDLVCINNKCGTRINNNGTLSHLDLALISSSLSAKVTFHVSQDSLGSDHFPIILNFSTVSTLPQTPTFYLNFKKACWNKICSHMSDWVERETCNINWNDPQLVYDKFTSTLTDSIKQYSPVICPKQKKLKVVPYWTRDCTVAISNKKRAQRKMSRTKNFADIEIYKNCKRIAQKTIHKAKTDYWGKYCSKIDKFSSLTKMWKTVKAINGKHSASNPHDNLDNIEELAAHFASYSTIDAEIKHFNETRPKVVKSYLDMVRKTPVYFENDLRRINQPFSLQELNHSLSSFKKVFSCADDCISYFSLLNLSEPSLEFLLHFINKSWDLGILPIQWKSADVKPVLKAGCSSADMSGFRPISITHSICKLMEKMIHFRLIWYLEKNGFVHKYQCGFRKNHCTDDNAARLFTLASDAVENNGINVTVFIDFSKAFDKIWIDGLLLKLFAVGITGKMYNWIKEFLSDRNFVVKSATNKSQRIFTTNGLPQGSTLSPTLFLLMTHDFPSLSTRTLPSIFADDCTISRTGENIAIVTHHIQNDLNTVSEWCNKWGFVINPKKTKAVLFSRKKNILTPNITITNSKIEFVPYIKYLGVHYDSKLSFKKHIEDILEKTKKRVNLLRCLTQQPWCSSKNLLVFYKNAIRSVIDFGSVVYSHSSPSLLKKLNHVQYTCLKIITGARLGCSLCSLEIYCNVLPLDLRRLELNSRFCLHYNSNTKKCLDVVFNTREAHLTKRNALSLIRYDAFKILKANQLCSKFIVNFVPEQIEYKVFSDTTNVNFDFRLLNLIHKNDDILVKKRQIDLFINEYYNSYLQIFTDGSFIHGHGCAAAVCIPRQNLIYSHSLSKLSNILTAELTAIFYALSIVLNIEERTFQKFVIFSDSLYALKEIQTGKSRNNINLVFNILNKIETCQNWCCQFVWLPSHSGCEGNETVDAVARMKVDSFQNLPVDVHLCTCNLTNDLQLCKFCDAYQFDTFDFNVWSAAMSNHSLSLWSARWTESPQSRHYYDVHSSIDTKWTFSFPDRFRNRILAQLRLNCSQLNECLFKLRKHDNGLCDICKLPETSLHFSKSCKSVLSAAFALRKKLRLSPDVEILLPLENLLNNKDLTPIIVSAYITKTKFIS